MARLGRCDPRRPLDGHGPPDADGREAGGRRDVPSIPLPTRGRHELGRGEGHRHASRGGGGGRHAARGAPSEPRSDPAHDPHPDGAVDDLREGPARQRPRREPRGDRDDADDQERPGKELCDRWVSSLDRSLPRTWSVPAGRTSDPSSLIPRESYGAPVHREPGRPSRRAREPQRSRSGSSGLNPPRARMNRTKPLATNTPMNA